jgi:hypothetical protein
MHTSTFTHSPTFAMAGAAEPHATTMPCTSSTPACGHVCNQDMARAHAPSSSLNESMKLTTDTNMANETTLASSLCARTHSHATPPHHTTQRHPTCAHAHTITTARAHAHVTLEQAQQRAHASDVERQVELALQTHQERLQVDAVAACTCASHHDTRHQRTRHQIPLEQRSQSALFAGDAQRQHFAALLCSTHVRSGNIHTQRRRCDLNLDEPQHAAM